MTGPTAVAAVASSALRVPDLGALRALDRLAGYLAERRALLLLAVERAVEPAGCRRSTPSTSGTALASIYRNSIVFHRNSMEGLAVGKLTVGALRAVLVVMLTGTVFVQAGLVWVLVTGSDPEDGSLPLTPLRVVTILGMVSVQVAVVCVWRLVSMVRRGTVFSHAAFRYVDVMIGAIVAAALVWFAVTALNAPGQRDDPGVSVIMAGVGVAILGVALIVLVLRTLLAQAVARDVEAAQMQAELDEVI